MGNPFDHLGGFLSAVLGHTITLAAGCLVTVMINLIEKHFMGGKKLPLKADIAILLLFVFFACFQAWHDEYTRANSLIHPPTQLPVIINVPQFPAPEVVVNQNSSPVPPIQHRWKWSQVPVTLPSSKWSVSVLVEAIDAMPLTGLKIICNIPCKEQSGLAQVSGMFTGVWMEQLLSPQGHPEIALLRIRMPAQLNPGNVLTFGIAPDEDGEVILKSVKTYLPPK